MLRTRYVFFCGRVYMGKQPSWEAKRAFRIAYRDIVRAFWVHVRDCYASCRSFYSKGSKKQRYRDRKAREIAEPFCITVSPFGRSLSGWTRLLGKLGEGSVRICISEKLSGGAAHFLSSDVFFRLHKEDIRRFSACLSCRFPSVLFRQFDEPES